MYIPNHALHFCVLVQLKCSARVSAEPVWVVLELRQRRIECVLDNRDFLLVAQKSAGEPFKNGARGDASNSQHSITRPSISDDKHALARLLRPGLADLRARGRTIDLNTNEELARLAPVLCACFSQDELAQLFNTQVAADMLRIHHTEMLQNMYLERALQDMLRVFNEAKIPLLLFKGPALAYHYYPQPHLRTYHDIDVLISPADLERAHDLLLRQGFKFYEEFRSNVMDEARSGYNYHLKQKDSWLEILVELHTAPHASDIGSRFDVQALWKEAEAITLLNEPVLIMSHIDHLLYLCWHYRFHGFTRLLWFYDIVVMARAAQSEMDWTELAKRARKLNLATTLYYLLLWCRDLFCVPIPERVFRMLRPPLVSRLVIERMAMPDVAKSLVSSLQQPQRILARRFMVDNSSDLLKAGTRTLFPSKATIGRRYMSHSRLPLRLYFVFYFIHPWVTLAKGVRFLFRKRENKG